MYQILYFLIIISSLFASYTILIQDHYPISTPIDSPLYHKSSTILFLSEALSICSSDALLLITMVLIRVYTREVRGVQRVSSSAIIFSLDLIVFTTFAVFGFNNNIKIFIYIF